MFRSLIQKGFPFPHGRNAHTPRVERVVAKKAETVAIHHQGHPVHGGNLLMDPLKTPKCATTTCEANAQRGKNANDTTHPRANSNSQVRDLVPVDRNAISSMVPQAHHPGGVPLPRKSVPHAKIGRQPQEGQIPAILRIHLITIKMETRNRRKRKSMEPALLISPT